MLQSAVEELMEKGYTDANDANALGSRATDGKLGNSSNKNTESSDYIWITEVNYLMQLVIQVLFCRLNTVVEPC